MACRSTNKGDTSQPAAAARGWVAALLAAPCLRHWRGFAPWVAPLLAGLDGAPTGPEGPSPTGTAARAGKRFPTLPSQCAQAPRLLVGLSAAEARREPFARPLRVWERGLRPQWTKKNLNFYEILASFFLSIGSPTRAAALDPWLALRVFAPVKK